ncbi:MAG: histidine phosphatase family protein, partial [Candidatus Binataceae bacterium]
MTAIANPSQLVLVRHGETVGNSSIRYYGRTDVALSELGRAQLRAAAAWLRTHHGVARFAQVFASPLSRAVEGARLIAGAHPGLIKIAEFAEVDFGIFEGLTAEEIRERHPVEFERWDRDRLAPDYTYPGGESRAAFTARVEGGVERMLPHLDAVAQPCADADGGATADGRSRTVLVVAHRGVIRVITRRLAGVEPRIELG